MTEVTRQRWLVGVIGIGSAFVGLLELRNVVGERRPLAIGLLILGIPAGFALLYARELYLRRSGKRPADKPGKEGMNTLFVIAIGMIVVFRLLNPLAMVFGYGVIAGLMLGIFVFIENDLRRLGRGHEATTARDASDQVDSDERRSIDDE